MNKHQDGFGLIAILVLLIIVSIVGVSVFYVYSSQKGAEETSVQLIDTKSDTEPSSSSKINLADFEEYAKNGISFNYPKDWILSFTETAELSQQRIFIKTNDYKFKGEPTSIRTFRVEKGYALEVSSSKSSVFSSTKEIYDYLSREGQSSAKIIKTDNGLEMVELVGMESSVPEYQSNSFTQAKFIYDGFEYSVIYYYPDSEEFISDSKYVDEYRYLLDTLKVK